MMCVVFVFDFMEERGDKVKNTMPNVSISPQVNSSMDKTHVLMIAEMNVPHGRLQF